MRIAKAFWRGGRASATALAGIALGGCVSFSYVDADNVRHIVGLVNLAIPEADAGREPIHAVTLTGIGVSVRTHPDTGVGVALGYTKETMLTLRNNACVDLKAPGPCAETLTVAAAAQEIK